MKKQLTNTEQLILDLNYEKQVGLTKEEAILVRDSKLILQHQKMLELQIEILKLQREKKEYEIKQIKEKKAKQKEDNRQYTKAIAIKYELKEGWGFNPDTGEIV